MFVCVCECACLCMSVDMQARYDHAGRNTDATHLKWGTRKCARTTSRRWWPCCIWKVAGSHQVPSHSSWNLHFNQGAWKPCWLLLPSLFVDQRIPASLHIPCGPFPKSCWWKAQSSLDRSNASNIAQANLLDCKIDIQHIYIVSTMLYFSCAELFHVPSRLHALESSMIWIPPGW